MHWWGRHHPQPRPALERTASDPALLRETVSLEHTRSAQIVGEVVNRIAGERPAAAVEAEASDSTRYPASRRAPVAPVSIATARS